MTSSGRFRAVAGPAAGVLLLFWMTNATAFGQQGSSLGEIAKKEEERRKKITVPAKIYTNKDLPKTAVTPPQPPSVSGAGSATAPSAAQKPTETPKPAEPKAEERRDEKDEAWWRARITAARTELQRSEMAAEAFQSRVNALTNDFAARDDPYQRAQIAIERQKTLNELERVKSEVVRLKQAIGDIEEEARVAGVPPGWLR